jgi:pyruvate carboxylase
MTDKKPLGITELVLRDAHQSLLATRFRIEDMLPIAGKLDQVGYWSMESWGGATFDSCIRYLGEDPWERIRLLKAAMPNTPQQMLFRGQNILGYRHYADDLVEKFVERCAINGVDVANRIGHRALRMFVDGERCFDRRLEIAKIVQRIKYPKHIHAVDRASLNKLLDQVVSVMTIAEYVLAAKQHLLWRVGHGRFQETYALPRVFTEVADAGIERRSAPGLN